MKEKKNTIEKMFTMFAYRTKAEKNKKEKITEENQFSEWKWKEKNILQNKTLIQPFSVQRTWANIESHAKAILPSADYHQSFKSK